jgi:hypothetical protein
VSSVVAVVPVVDPELTVPAGGTGQAPGFAKAAAAELGGLLPFVAGGARLGLRPRRRCRPLPGLGPRAGLATFLDRS